MFKENDLVRLITDEGDAEIMRVLEDSDAYETDNEVGTTHCSVNDEGADGYFDTADLELVTDSQEVQEEECKPMAPNVPTRTQEEIHEDIKTMFVQCIQYARELGCTSCLTLTIKAEHYMSSDDVAVTFKAGTSYDNFVESGNLFTSTETIIQRDKENKFLQPIALPLYKETAE